MIKKKEPSLQYLMRTVGKRIDRRLWKIEQKMDKMLTMKDELMTMFKKHDQNFILLNETARRHESHIANHENRLQALEIST